jgi:hypothetical protein
MKTDQPDVIHSPHDNVIFAPDWRWQAARHLSEPATPMKLNRAAIKDPWVGNAVKYLRATGKSSRMSEEEQAVWRRTVQLAEDVSLQNIRHTVEALLLTDAPLEALAADTGLPIAEIKLFERLFFNVRDDDGRMVLRPLQRQFIATMGALKTRRQLPAHLMWRRVAVEAGYTALVRVLQLGSGSWSEAKSVDLVQSAIEMGRADIMAQMASGELNAAAVHRMEFNRLREKQLRLLVGEEKGETEAREILLKILQSMAPSMVEFQKLKEAQEAVLERAPHLNAQIQETKVVDVGYEAGAEAMAMAVRNKLAPIGEKMLAGKRAIEEHEKSFVEQFKPGN